jgi:hypothetical protein
MVVKNRSADKEVTAPSKMKNGKDLKLKEQALKRKGKSEARRTITPDDIPSEMRNLVLSIIEERRLEHWLRTPIPDLDYKSPQVLIQTGQTEGLMQMLRRAGTY